MITPTFRLTLILLLSGAMAAVIAALLVFGGVLPPYRDAPYDPAAFGEPHFDFRQVAFADLDGWLQDDPEPAFSAFLLSCDRYDNRDAGDAANPNENLGEAFTGVTLGGVVADWQRICEQARLLRANSYSDPSSQRSAVRRFFEFEFRPIQILVRRDPLPDGPARKEAPNFEEEGVFTGYFEPSYAASHGPSALHTAPVYTRPDDLIDVDLGAFRDDLAGERIAGRVEGSRFVPYPDHQEINKGALAGKADPIAWMAPTDLFFLQIQGSGQLVFDNGERLRIGYAGQNGHTYTAIGRVMVERNIMALEEVSMQTIRSWLQDASPETARAMREENASYVFFRTLDAPAEGLGPPGAQGAALTTERSLAVDLRFHTLGAPVWVDIDPVTEQSRRRYQRLMVAQDTGGAIKGPVRGDVFWGASARAEEIAGAMNAGGRMYVLVPRTLAAQLPARPEGRKRL